MAYSVRIGLGAQQPVSVPDRLNPRHIEVAPTAKPLGTLQQLQPRATQSHLALPRIHENQLESHASRKLELICKLRSSWRGEWFYHQLLESGENVVERVVEIAVVSLLAQGNVDGLGQRPKDEMRLAVVDDETKHWNGIGGAELFVCLRWPVRR